MSLTELAIHFGTDKWGNHWYTPQYQRQFEPLRSERFTLLEIGIGGHAEERAGGASLRMWKVYFPKAQIVGLDIEDKSWLDRNRIRTCRGSQTDAELLRRIVREAGGVRVVIDDGSHTPSDVRATFDILFPLLDHGGFYAIEDTQTSYWPEWGGSERLDDPSTTMSFVKGLVDGVNYEEYVDEDYSPSYTDQNVVAIHVYHNLVIIEKGWNAERTRRRGDPEGAVRAKRGAFWQVSIGVR